MAYRAVIFDLDGTLLDTLGDLTDALNRVLQERGLPTHPAGAVAHFVGDGSARLVLRALPPEKRNDDLVADCSEAFLEAYHRSWKIKTRPYDGVSALLDALSEKHIQIAVLSNKPQHFAELCIQEFFSDWKFAVVLGQQTGVPMKPDPTGAREIARNLGIPPQDFLFLGDSNVDIITAVRADMLPLGAAWGFRSEHELSRAGAADIIHRPEELLKFIN